MSKLIQFIKENDNWKELLKEKPYELAFDETENHVLLKYSQIKSDFNNDLVQESRGSIIDKSTLEFVCRPFDKFYNLHEGRASEIDWNTAKIQEKLDGSIIKIWWNSYEDKWQISSMGCINASRADLASQIDIRMMTFEDLVLHALKDFDFGLMNKEFTYIFEIMSPLNRVVVPHKEVKIAHIGTRNNKTGQECNVDIGLQKPRLYNFNSMDDLVESAKQLPFDEEGYIVVDANYNRVKIKGFAYLSVHRMCENGVLTPRRIVDLIKINEHDEYLSYYPEHIPHFVPYLYSYNEFISEIEDDFEKCQILKEDKKYGSKVHRKEYAEFASKCIYPAILFNFYNNIIDKSGIRSFFIEQDSRKILQYLNL